MTATTYPTPPRRGPLALAAADALDAAATLTSGPRAPGRDRAVITLRRTRRTALRLAIFEGRRSPHPWAPAAVDLLTAELAERNRIMALTYRLRAEAAEERG